MPEKISIVHGNSPTELYKAVAEREILSFRDLLAARVEVAMLRFRQHAISLEAQRPNFEEGVVLARTLKNDPLWTHRLTTATHTIRTKGGYLTRELNGTSSAPGEIVDGGVPYSIRLRRTLGDRFMSEGKYNSVPGGSYPVEAWLTHPVLQDVANDEEVLAAYGRILSVLSHASLGSQGRASIWCPQSLPVGHGRAWALGEGGDAAYPPNATTKHHWAAVRD